jgi:adenylate kinase family enzyme
MWKDSVELKVIRLEGFPCSSTELACYLYFNDALHDQLIPINEEKSLMVTEDGIYRLEICNQNTQEEKSVSFQMDLFTEDGVRWLPLFTHKQDFITEIPLDVNLPRILVIFYRKRLLTVIEEKNSTEEIPEPEVFNTQESLNEEPLVSALIPDEKLLQNYKIALEYERKLREDQEKNINKLSKELHDALERSQIREDSLLQLITVKEEELHTAQIEISNLRSKLRKIEFEKTQLNDIIESLKSERVCLNIEGLQKELAMFTCFFKDSDDISRLKAKLDVYENKEQVYKQQEELILDTFRSKGKNFEVKRENEVVYMIARKKISVYAIDNILFYRNLGPLQKFEDFFSTVNERSMTPSNKFHKRNGSDSKSLEIETKDTVTKRVNTSFVNTKKYKITEKRS